MNNQKQLVYSRPIIVDLYDKPYSQEFPKQIGHIINQLQDAQGTIENQGFEDIFVECLYNSLSVKGSRSETDEEYYDRMNHLYIVNKCKLINDIKSLESQIEKLEHKIEGTEKQIFPDFPKEKFEKIRNRLLNSDPLTVQHSHLLRQYNELFTNNEKYLSIKLQQEKELKQIKKQIKDKTILLKQIEKHIQSNKNSLNASLILGK